MSKLGRPVDHAAREAKTERILAAAVSCFVQKGFHGAGMSEICREAGISQASLYQYFASKNDLIVEIAKRYFSEDAAMLTRIKVGDSIFDSIFQEALRDEQRLPQWEQDSIMRLEIMAEAARNAKVKQVVDQGNQELGKILTAITEQNQQAGIVRGDLPTAELAEFVATYLDGVNYRAALHGEQFSASAFTQLLRKILEK